MADYTPAPWTIEAHPERGGWYIRHYADEVAYVPPSATTDARLIASAPDQHDALTEVADVLNRMLHDEDGWPPDRLAARLMRLETIARAAIAKTTGTETTDEA